MYIFIIYVIEIIYVRGSLYLINIVVADTYVFVGKHSIKMEIFYFMTYTRSSRYIYLLYLDLKPRKKAFYMASGFRGIHLI